MLLKTKEVKTICIVGGGSAGWMSAATITKLFPDIQVYLIESPDFKTIGVGESTIAPAINTWLEMLEIKDKDFMKECDATYKLGIMFKDFYKKDTEQFFYPFQKPYERKLPFGKNAWFYKKQMNPALSNADYARFITPITHFADQYKMPKNPMDIPGFNADQNIAYHFDATKLGQWLKNKFIKSNKFKHVLEEIKSVETDDNGIKTLNKKYTADLFLDCSGFKSLLMEKMGCKKNRTPSKILINNQAWTAHVPYDDVNKKEEMKPYTLCTAINNGWVWEIPTWGRLGVGYVHSDKYIETNTALVEFQKYLKAKGYKYKDLKYKLVKFDTYRHEKMFVKNVCSIGLASCFIEPLESTGLVTIHENLLALARCLKRHGHITQLDRDSFNLHTNITYDGYVDFVGMHYYATARNDNEYWNHYRNNSILDLSYSKTEDIFLNIHARMIENFYSSKYGFHYIAAGMNFDPLELMSPKAFREEYQEAIKVRDDWVEKIKEEVKKEPTHFEYLKNKIYG